MAASPTLRCYAAGLPRPPLFGAPQFVWVCSECKETFSDGGPEGSAGQLQRLVQGDGRDVTAGQVLRRSVLAGSQPVPRPPEDADGEIALDGLVT